MAVPRFRSHLAASLETVWAEARTMEGVNAELGPWIRMTRPPGASSLDDARAHERIARGEPLFDSWLLVGGALPFDRHRLTLERIVDEPDLKGFDERSASWAQAEWVHRRRIRREGDGCEVTDELEVTPRLRGLRPLIEGVVRRLFEVGPHQRRHAHHHRRSRHLRLPLTRAGDGARMSEIGDARRRAAARSPLRASSA